MTSSEAKYDETGERKISVSFSTEYTHTQTRFRAISTPGTHTEADEPKHLRNTDSLTHI